MSRLAGLNDTLKELVFNRFKTLNDGQGMRRVLETMELGDDREDLIEKIKDVNDKLNNEVRENATNLVGITVCWLVPHT